MDRMIINEKISYIEGTENPLSADIGIVKAENCHWLYDVGNGEQAISDLKGSYHVVLSHFHPDHIGNISRIPVRELYLSKETHRYIPKEVLASCSVQVVTKPVKIGSLHIFPLPSSHAKGCLGFEIDGTYAFVGDALYCKAKKNACVYNTQLLKAEIEVLKNLSAPFVLVSHFKGFIRRRTEVLEELETIYDMRSKESAEISIG